MSLYISYWEDPRPILHRPLFSKIGKNQKQNLFSKSYWYGYCWLRVSQPVCAACFENTSSLHYQSRTRNITAIQSKNNLLYYKSNHQTKLHRYPYKGPSHLLLVHNAKVTNSWPMPAYQVNTIPYSPDSHKAFPPWWFSEGRALNSPSGPAMQWDFQFPPEKRGMYLCSAHYYFEKGN